MLLKSVFMESEVESYQVTGKQREVLIFPVQVNKEALLNPIDSYHSFKYSIMKRFAKGLPERVSIIDSQVNLDFYQGLCKEALEKDDECGIIQIEVVPFKLDMKEKRLENEFKAGVGTLEKHILDEVVSKFLTE